MHRMTVKGRLLILLLLLIVTIEAMAATLYFYLERIAADNLGAIISTDKYPQDKGGFKLQVILPLLLALISLTINYLFNSLSFIFKKYIEGSLLRVYKGRIIEGLNYLTLDDLKKLYPKNDLFVKLESNLHRYVTARMNAYFYIIQGSIYVLSSVIFLILINWFVAIIIGFISLSFSLSRFLFAKALLRKNERFTKRHRIFINRTQEYLNNYELLLSFRGERLIYSRTEREARADIFSRWDLWRGQEKQRGYSNLYISILAEIPLLILFLLLFFNIFKDFLTFGFIFIIINVFMVLANRFPQLILANQQLTISRDLVKEIFIPKPRDKKKPLLEDKNFSSLKIRDLNFSFEDKRILSGINLYLKPRQRLLIKGPSGVGKSTFLSILMGFERGYLGSVRLNKQEVKKLDSSLYHIFSYSVSDDFVFDDNVKNNITLWEDVDDESLRETMIRSNLISDLSLEDITNRRALQLSEGQKQRMCLARVLLQRKPILILDEALSNLDKDNVVSILQNLKDDKETTFIVVSHLPNLEEYFDRKMDFKGTY